MKIAIVILNWNGKSLLEKFLPSIIRNSQEANVIVADNNSSDGSIDFLKKEFPKVTIIQNKSNWGFAKGYNEALKEVEADVYILVNSDVEVTENWLFPIQEIFEKEEKTAVVQPKILDYNKKAYFEYAGGAGGYIDRYGFPYCRGRIFDELEKDKGQYEDSIQIGWASGACFAIRKEVFDNLGGFDSDFFAHQEEIDLCWRAHNQGYQVKSAPNSKVYHVGGATLESTSSFKTYLNFRNGLFMLLKNLPSQQLFGTILFRMILDGIAGLRFLFKGNWAHFLAVLKAHFHFYLGINKMYKKRLGRTRPGYYHVESIVQDYFVHKKKFFSQLK